MSDCWSCGCGSDGSASPDTSVTGTATAKAVAERLGAAGERMEIEPATARLMVRALRRIAAGAALTPESLRALADSGDGAAQTVAAVSRMAETDAAGRIVGLLGLSLADHPHEFFVRGRRLTTWCAWDTLFLAPVLGAEALVRTEDPETGAPIKVVVSPEGVDGAPDLVVSIVFPEIPDDGSWNAVQAQEVFCNYVHFFTGRESAERWFARRDVPGRGVPSRRDAVRSADRSLNYGAVSS